MTRRRLIIGASIAVAAIGGWWCVVRPLAELRIAAIRPWQGPRWGCDRSHTMIRCFRASQPHRRGGPPPVEQLSYCLATLSLTHFMKVRIYPDSLTWMRARDSVNDALSQRPRRRKLLSLGASLYDAAVPLAATRTRHYGVVSSWVLPRWEVSAYASRSTERTADTTADYGMAVAAFADPSCSLPRWPRIPEHLHVVTISEALAAIHRTIAEQIGF